MIKWISALILSMLNILPSTAQDTPWNHKKAAVVLTYDDAIDQHLDNAVPLLDSLQLKASFYITGYSSSVRNRMEAWRSLAARGHELGNHTLYHPCVGGKGREWVRDDYDMNHYTVRRMVDETRMNNLFLQALDGKTSRTFAFTCGDMKVSDGAFIDSLKNDFVAARAVREQMHTIDQVDLYNVDCYAVSGQTAEQMMAWVDQAVASKSLLVILFHGVGGGNALNVLLPEHRKFLQYLKKREADIWVAPLLTVASYVKQYQHR
ncbi:MAG TPA: polysaccharide deacetylase family protein [Chitinophagaceae bacterium]|nr:polysaccharide deacetylase family protein [Chitinophagaceae bacterium]